jgi:hypothetical protein
MRVNRCVGGCAGAAAAAPAALRPPRAQRCHTEASAADHGHSRCTAACGPGEGGSHLRVNVELLQPRRLQRKQHDRVRPDPQLGADRALRAAGHVGRLVLRPAAVQGLQQPASAHPPRASAAHRQTQPCSPRKGGPGSATQLQLFHALCAIGAPGPLTGVLRSPQLLQGVAGAALRRVGVSRWRCTPGAMSPSRRARRGPQAGSP